jgi:hypothetical protein
LNIGLRWHYFTIRFFDLHNGTLLRQSHDNLNQNSKSQFYLNQPYLNNNYTYKSDKLQQLHGVTLKNLSSYFLTFFNIFYWASSYEYSEIKLGRKSYVKDQPADTKSKFVQVKLLVAEYETKKKDPFTLTPVKDSFEWFLTNG